MANKQFSDPEREYLQTLVRDRMAADAEVARTQRSLSMYVGCLRKQYDPPKSHDVAEDLSGFVPAKPKRDDDKSLPKSVKPTES